MKKVLKIASVILLSIIIALTSVACGAPKASSGSGECGSGVSWEYNSDTNVLSISGNGSMKDYGNSADVPWASARASVKTITISDGVERIGDHAFYGFTALESVSLPDSVASVGKSAFAFSTVLKSISLPAALLSIGEGAFEGCSALSAAFVPASVTTLGERAFAYCYSVTDAAILAPVSIPANAFLNCRSIDKLILNTNITAEMVAEDAFKGCSVDIDDATRTESQTASASVTVKYIDTEGNEISETVVKGELEYGASYSVVSPEIEGYTADKLTVSGHVYGENVTETVTYTKDEAEVTTPIEEQEPDNEITSSTIIAIVILGVVLVGIAIAAFLIFRSEKKNANASRTVRNNANNKNNKNKRK